MLFERRGGVFRFAVTGLRDGDEVAGWVEMVPRLSELR